MSLLLDALNKADQERKRNDATPSIDSVHENPNQYQRRSISTPLIVVVAGTLLAAVLSSVYWLGKHTKETELTKSTGTEASLSSQAMSSVPNPTIENNLNKAQPETVPDNNQPEESVANLYQQKIASSEPSNNATATIENTVTTPTTETRALNSLNQFGNVPEIHDLPQSLLTRIPSMNYSEHNFNNLGGSVKINGQIKHINDQILPGVVLDKILEDGIILHFENYEFKMRALNSWINM